MLAVAGCLVPGEELVFFYVADVLCFTGLGGRGKNWFFFYVAVDVWEELVFFYVGPPGPWRALSTAPNIKKNQFFPRRDSRHEFFMNSRRTGFFLCCAGFRNVPVWVVAAPWDHEDISTQRQQGFPNFSFREATFQFSRDWKSGTPFGRRPVGTFWGQVLLEWVTCLIKCASCPIIWFFKWFFVFSYDFYMIFIWFYLFFTWFYLFFTWFYMVFTWLYLIFIWFYMFFIWFLYDSH